MDAPMGRNSPDGRCVVALRSVTCDMEGCSLNKSPHLLKRIALHTTPKNHAASYNEGILITKVGVSGAPLQPGTQT